MNINDWITAALDSGCTPEDLASAFAKTLNETTRERAKQKAEAEHKVYTDTLIDQLGKDIKELSITHNTAAVVATLALIDKEPSISQQEAEAYRKMIAEAIGNAGELFIKVRNKDGSLPKAVKCVFDMIEDSGGKKQLTQVEHIKKVDPKDAITDFLREVGLL